MKKVVLTVLLCCLASIDFVSAASAAGKEYKLLSPDGAICIMVQVGEQISWSVEKGGEQLLTPSEIALVVDGSTLQSKRMREIRRQVDQMLTATVPIKRRSQRDHFNELRLSCPEWAVVWRAYDNGVAYRIETALKGDVKVEDELAEFNFASDCSVYWAAEANPDFITHCEANFKNIKLSETSQQPKSFLPLSLLSPKGTRMVLTETDLHDYPNMFVQNNGCTALKAVFSPVLAKTEMRGDRNVNVLERAPYISATGGKRSFPWRILTIGDDRSLLENNLAWQLASPQVEGDVSWIKPGKISWEWWAMLNVYGVDFKAGVNTQTYKYYVDFAAAYGLEYILMDEGWSASTLDITHPQPELDVRGIIDYAKSKGVGVVLWTLWTPMMKDMKNILDVYQSWGVSGIKIDFMQMNDQNMVNFYEDVARECFARKLLVDYHGSFKPVGLHRMYPNVMSYEGVYGMEHDKCSFDISPDHDLVLPFTRMVAGPMDYTPGATINATKDDFSIRWCHPMSQGTRAHQASLFVSFDSAVQMLCDSPSNYNKVPEFTSFIAAVPTVWDETIALEAVAGSHLVVARRNGDSWYIGGLNNWTRKSVSCALDFLGEGEWEMDYFADGANADVWAEDYVRSTFTVSASTVLTIDMANGGGFAAKLTKK